MAHEVDIVVIGAGAAGLAAARQLHSAGISTLVLEARDRIGGRAWTLQCAGIPLDLGCGWLHSADENEWTGIAAERGFTVDRTPPPWSRQKSAIDFSEHDQKEFRVVLDRFYAKLEVFGAIDPDRPASDLVDPNGRWTPLLNALSTYINGAELEHVSVHDFARYHDTEVNWRVREGYGALIADYGAGLDIRLDCAATRIDHSGHALRIDTPHGAVTARAVIVTIPSTVIAQGGLRFTPDLPEQVAAASGLPLGLADKVYLSVDDAAELPAESRVFGDHDNARTGAYHLRPLGKPIIEGYFGGVLARDLEAEGEGAFATFATEQLVGYFGSDFRKRLRPLAASAWASDPFARGSYSYAKPGHAAARAVLAAPVNDRIFFAGEACSLADFSTAHGAYRTGVAAAVAAMRSVAR